MAPQNLRRFVLAALSACLIFYALVIPTNSFAADESRTFRVGVYDNKPKVYLDENGVAKGLFPDILNFIAKQENWTLEYVPGTWDEGLVRLEKGDVDIMPDVALSLERQKLYDFTNETVLSSWGVVFVQKNSAIDSFQDLDGKKIAILKSGIYFDGPEGVGQYIQAFGLHVEFTNVKEYAEVFDLLNKGEVDAAVVSRIFALTNQARYPNIKQTDMFFNPTELRFALTKGNPANGYLTERLDYWVTKLKGGYNGVFQGFLEKYELSGLVVGKEVIPPWIRTAGLALLAILFIAGLVIVALKRAEVLALKKLKEKEVLLSNVVEHTAIAIFSFNSRGIVTLAKGKAIKEIGFQQGCPMDKFMFDQLKKAFDGNDVDLQSEVAGKVWRLNTSPLKVNGKVTEVVGVAVDLTQEVQFDRIQTEFLSLVAHHLRTLPTGIKWILELLSPKIKKGLDAKDRQHWKNLEESNSRMIELANSIARASQLELGKFSISTERFNLPKLIDEEIEKMHPLIRQKKLNLTKRYNGVEEIELDKELIKIIVNTLLTNSTRYISPEGSIQISLLSGRNTITIKVQDTGWGIPKGQQPMVFTKMFRADNVARLDVNGIGLGLFVAKIVVEKLKGKIWFESEENHGSTFYVELPQNITTNQ